MSTRKRNKTPEATIAAEEIIEPAQVAPGTNVMSREMVELVLLVLAWYGSSVWNTRTHTHT
jgi:hypothetical protein